MAKEPDVREIDMTAIVAAYERDPARFLTAWMHAHTLASRSMYMAPDQLADPEQASANLAAMNEVGHVVAQQLSALGGDEDVLPTAELFTAVLAQTEYQGKHSEVFGDIEGYLSWSLETATVEVAPLRPGTGGN